MLAAGLLFIMVFAQDVVPTWAGFHVWQYAFALVLCVALVVGYIGYARRGAAGETDERMAVALCGALLVGGAGLASGLLGPDTVLAARAPGTVLPLPDLDAAAFFPNVGADAIARGDIGLLLRRRAGDVIAMQPGIQRFLGAYALELRSQHAVYVEVHDKRGNHLTVTQPMAGTFLSPVLLFPSTVRIGARNLPADAFMVPAAHRRVEAMYFSPKAVLFAVDDDIGRLLPRGIVLAADGTEVAVGDLRIRARVGSYPALSISAVPVPLALWLGSSWCIIGLLWVAYPWGRRWGEGIGSRARGATP
jgi:hypothetical protein